MDVDEYWKSRVILIFRFIIKNSLAKYRSKIKNLVTHRKKKLEVPRTKYLNLPLNSLAIKFSTIQNRSSFSQKKTHSSHSSSLIKVLIHSMHQFTNFERFAPTVFALRLIAVIESGQIWSPYHYD